MYTPDHDVGLHHLSDEHAAEFVGHLPATAAPALDQLPNVRYTQVIVNHGREAGASIAHPHAQILGLPYVPGEVLEEERAFARFAGGCLLCTTIEAELAADERVVHADDDIVCIAPFWSGTPYELLLMPRRHETHLQRRRSGVGSGDGTRHPRRDPDAQHGARRRRLQHRLPHRTAPPHRPVPLARPRLAQPRHPGGLRTWHRA